MLFTIVMLLAAFAFQVQAKERLPDGAKTLVEIIKIIEANGYKNITEISLDNGVWEVEVYKDNQERELKINPMTGEIISDRQDD